MKLTNEIKKRAEELVAQMTIEEKCSQLRYDSPAIDRLGIPAYNWWNEGLHGVARGGTATMYPQAIGIAAAFDEELTRRIAHDIGIETRVKYNCYSAHDDRDIYKGLTIWSPNINIFRDPRWGRGHETYGEDPYLTGLLGTAYVEGLQGDGEYMLASACAKHFAVHSGPENLRHEFDAQCSDKDLYETYLYAFKKLINAGVSGVMGAYNRVNGEPACANTELMRILREEWGFDGYFVSDCWAIQDFHMHHKITSDFIESASLALKKGCDVNCGCSYAYILQAYNEGLVTEAEINRSVRKLFEIRFALGMFDATEFDGMSYSLVDCPEHNKNSLEAAQKSMVLLKNDGILPLDKNKIKTIGVIGPAADSRDALKGNYYGTASRYTTFLQGIQEQCGDDIRVLYSEGCDYIKDRCEGLAMAGDRISEAVITAENSDAVILCVGLNEHIEGEEGDTGNEYASGDKESLMLPESQQKLIKAVLDTGKPVVVVLSAGSSVNIGDERENALICAWYSGPHGGKALADIIFGEISPSGKLPVTFYKDTDKLPEFTDYSMKNRTYRYIENNDNVLYPFGYGLTYSDFGCRIAEIADGENGKIVTVEAENKGNSDSGEVIQLYIHADDENAPINPWLCGIKRIFLKAGEKAQYKISVENDSFDIYSGAETHRTDKYKLWAGFGQPVSGADFVMAEVENGKL
ncbi:MAG: glycoside hydrolase family 3 C-terminal domain-containing protein [Ruminiclostridium sp.]|nr:glycoside hydrolase family 3 C-terminal domain-containing protein [Ruminiclostridium sp.]